MPALSEMSLSLSLIQRLSQDNLCLVEDATKPKTNAANSFRVPVRLHLTQKGSPKHPPPQPNFKIFKSLNPFACAMSSLASPLVTQL